MVADDPQLQAGARLLHIGPHNGGSATKTEYLERLQGIPAKAVNPGFWPGHRRDARGRNVRFQAQGPGIQTWPRNIFHDAWNRIAARKRCAKKAY